MSMRPRGIRDSRTNHFVCRNSVLSCRVLHLGIDQGDGVPATWAELQLLDLASSCEGLLFSLP